ncbi:hypothetical protein SeMB42_g07285 [Synchytrium endobioticum]|uniref:Uncharacterized protein n=1 Tax=Synchytrium endobioticum TaxID=286115 RepID=A0A507C5J4_9FUNG|nr:hypothetical protein SeMB42_g07285 [Synchytrium endobioticum]
MGDTSGTPRRSFSSLHSFRQQLLEHIIKSLHRQPELPTHQSRRCFGDERSPQRIQLLGTNPANDEYAKDEASDQACEIGCLRGALMKTGDASRLDTGCPFPQSQHR